MFYLLASKPALKAKALISGLADSSQTSSPGLHLTFLPLICNLVAPRRTQLLTGALVTTQQLFNGCISFDQLMSHIHFTLHCPSANFNIQQAAALTHLTAQTVKRINSVNMLATFRQHCHQYQLHSFCMHSFPGQHPPLLNKSITKSLDQVSQLLQQP
jgi:hypothetical protein